LKIIEKYVCLKKIKYEFKDYYLIPIREKDIQKIRIWRNKQMDILRQKKKISKKEQIDYYESILVKKFNEKKPDTILFSYMLNDDCIGYGGLTNIDWISKKAEISFITNNLRHVNSDVYFQDFSCFLNIIIQLAFQELKFNRLFTETYNVRPLHLKILEKIGFELEEEIKQYVNIKGKYVDSLIHGYLREKYTKK
jgi:RimJ/RimL family protein N-acetyltransferase